jgi:hypothetical protein
VAAVTWHSWLGFDGILFTDDLAVQAFARHVAARCPEPGAVIGGMRGFLEGRPELIPPGIWRSTPQTGEDAVRRLAAAAGVSAAEVEQARRASRADLAASAWLLDRADGLDELLARLADLGPVSVLADPADPATTAVLDALNLAPGAVTGIDSVVDPATAAPGGCEGERPALVIEAAFTSTLDQAGRTGAITVVVDRFGAGAGTPTLRAPDLPGLAGPLAAALDPARAGSRR